jgi:hypothetical protein
MLSRRLAPGACRKKGCRRQTKLLCNRYCPVASIEVCLVKTVHCFIVEYRSLSERVYKHVFMAGDRAIWFLIHGNGRQIDLMGRIDLFLKSPRSLDRASIWPFVRYEASHRNCTSIPLDDFLAVATNAASPLPQLNTFNHFLVWPRERRVQERSEIESVVLRAILLRMI